MYPAKEARRRTAWSRLASLLRRRSLPLPGWEVRGRATRDDGVPAVHARLSLIDAEGRRVSSHVADRSGAFRLRAPARGRYLLVAGCAGYFPDALPVVAAAPLTTAHVRLVASSSIRGTVREEGVAIPVARAVVVLIDALGAVLRCAVTGDQGGYAFTGLEAGTYSLAVDHRHRRPVVRPVRVTPHSCSVTDITVGQRLVTVAGVVRDRDGGPVAGARVTLADDSGLWLSTHTDADGRYRFTALPAGEYTLGAGPGPGGTRRLLLDDDRRGADLVVGPDSPGPPGP
jgi:hypothetical protein